MCHDCKEQHLNPTFVPIHLAIIVNNCYKLLFFQAFSVGKKKEKVRDKKRTKSKVFVLIFKVFYRI